MKKQKQKQIFRFDPAVYPFKLWVARDTSLESLASQFRIVCDDGSTLPMNTIESHNGVACSMPGTELCVEELSTGKYGFLVYIRQPSQITVGMVAHESSHISRMALSYIGEVDASFEAEAYLVGWIADCIWKVATKNVANGGVTEKYNLND